MAVGNPYIRSYMAFTVNGIDQSVEIDTLCGDLGEE